MKKKILVILLMLIPVITFAETCEFNKDTQSTSDRNLVCDAEKRTTTTFKTTGEKTVLSNSVCEIKCTEEVVFSIDPIKKVLAGTSFSYPLYASGMRKCNAVYNYSQYEAKIKALVNEYETLTGTAKKTKGNEITNYYAQKKACDEFSVNESEYQNKYSYNANVSLKVETSKNEVTMQYIFSEIDEYSSTLILDEANYSSCNFSENNKKCLGDSKTIAGWTETARIYGKYTMKDVYIENYTGDIKDIETDNTCNAGDRFFTNFNELTRTSEKDTTDKGYKLTLTARNLGNNLVATSEKWNLNVDCWYQVNNLMFPQNNIGGNVDDNYDDYGGTAFQYRLIDLDNPFPGRSPMANWKGKESIIYSTKDNLSSLQKFVINLNRNSISKIREYNDTYSYDTFNLDEMEKSQFIINNPSIVDRK